MIRKCGSRAQKRKTSCPRTLTLVRIVNSENEAIVQLSKCEKCICLRIDPFVVRQKTPNTKLLLIAVEPSWRREVWRGVLFEGRRNTHIKRTIHDPLQNKTNDNCYASRASLA